MRPIAARVWKGAAPVAGSAGLPGVVPAALPACPRDGAPRPAARPESAPAPGRTARGARAWQAGRMAEEAVLRHYRARGAHLLQERWRGACGEIDLVLQDGGRVVFVEVKSGPDHATAQAALGPRQMARLRAAAEDYLGRCALGLLTECRIDLALVDRRGMIEIIPNAGMDF